MSTISALHPLNLLEEKSKFFADEKYNPQFIYQNDTQDSLAKHPYTIDPQLRDLAHMVLKKCYHNRNESDLFMMEGRALSQNEVTKMVEEFLHIHGLYNRFSIVWSSSFLSRTTITQDTLKLRLPCDFRREGLLGMLYHEVGTHALRRINYEHQPWYKKKKKLGFSEYLETEEGLASLHALIPHSFNGAYIAALRYAAVDIAQASSFAEVWRFLKPYTQDLERRWIITVRLKRGLTDTSQPGGSSKDLVYFAGAYSVWHWLKRHEFDCSKLYFGKLAAEDVPLALELNPDYQPLLPSFFAVEREQYAKRLAEIGMWNMFDELTIET